MARSRSRAGSLSSINVTPLTDVLLVLLITFLLTASAFREHDTDLLLPRVMSAQEVNRAIERVMVDATGKVSFQDEKLSKLELEDALLELRKSGGKAILGLAFSRDLSYERVYPILLAAQLAGWEQLVILAEVKR